MRRGACARAATLVGLTLAGYLTSSSLTGGLTGIAPADAAQFYTRKRVNGRWINGVFPKGQRTARRTPTRSVSIRVAALAAPVLAAPIAVFPPPRYDAGLPATGAVADPDETTVTSALGPAAAAVETPSLPLDDERLLKLRRALQARADEIVATQQAPAGSGQADLPALSVRPALPDRAVALPASVVPTEAALSSAPSAGKEVQRLPSGPAASGAALQPKSVSYDFETGIKTIVYESSVVREPFDVAAMRSMAGRLPPSGR